LTAQPAVTIAKAPGKAWRWCKADTNAFIVREAIVVFQYDNFAELARLDGLGAKRLVHGDEQFILRNAGHLIVDSAWLVANVASLTRDTAQGRWPGFGAGIGAIEVDAWQIVLAAERKRTDGHVVQAVHVGSGVGSGVGLRTGRKNRRHTSRNDATFYAAIAAGVAGVAHGIEFLRFVEPEDELARGYSEEGERRGQHEATLHHRKPPGRTAAVRAGLPDRTTR
jgi:hypothetical protein